MHDPRNMNKNKLIPVIILIIAGVAVNFAGSALASVLPLSLYLDCIGTIAVGALGGFIPGIITGILSSILASFYSGSLLYFSVINVITAILAAAFSRRDLFRRIPHVLVTIVILGVVHGILGTVIEWFLNGAVPLNGMGFMPLLLSRMLTGLLDMAICVIIAAVILKFIPQKLYDYYDICRWRSQRHGLLRHRRVSLNAKVVVLITSATLLVAVAIAAICISEYNKDLIEEQAAFGTDIVNLAASYIDADRVDDYLENGRNAEGYAEAEEQLQRIWDNSDNIEYLYCYRILEDGCHVVFDADTPELDGGEPGELIPFDQSFEELIPALLAGEQIDPIVTDDTYGWLLTVYRPVFDSAGKCSCYMATDISMPKLAASESIFFIKLISLFLSIYLLIVSFGIRYCECWLIKPVNAMADAAGEFAYNSEAARGDTVEHIKSLGVCTGDEIEELYHSLVKTAEDTARYINEVQEKNEAINKLQNGLIMVLADLVESRDKSTGDHVKHTASYVQIIMDQMRKEGIYADALTDEFVQNVVDSAPLHDIGKIKVPDAILNKPGKLTDDEFSQMKLHAPLGGNIIADAIDKLDKTDTGYLSEARNLASSHHEKWDGSGYPAGLKGEEIPLSARIMAVADVFDALISKRSYKDGMPFEKAMSIIKEGSGSHFDPAVVKAFIDAEDQVRKVSEENNSEAGGTPHEEGI